MLIAAYLPGEGEFEYSRRLAGTMLDPAYGDIILTIALIVMVAALSFQVICNLFYTTGLALAVWNQDCRFKDWRKKHRWASGAVLAFCYLVSFHVARLFYCGMCNQSCFKVEVEDMGKIKKGLVKYGYVSLFCTHMPMMAAQVLLLVHFQQGYWIWMFSLDSLIITVFLTLFIFCDLRSIEKDLIKYELEQIPKESSQNLEINDQLKDLISLLPPLSLKAMIPPKISKYKIRKGISRSLAEFGNLENLHN